MHKKTVLKKLHYFFKMNDKRRSFMLLKILDQIQQDNADAKDGINKSAATICNEKSISFEQAFYILCFYTAFVSNKSYFILLFDLLYIYSK